MNCAKRTGVYAFFLGISLCAQAIAAISVSAGDKEGRTVNTAAATPAAATTATEFQWHEHSRLSWEDFKGPVGAEDDQTAAATHCGMGFKTVSGADGKQEIVVYNKFYVNKSWVRSDAKLQEILDHEQGHFDLCELYTRKLRQRLSNVDLDSHSARQVLYRIYTEVNAEYERRQQRYEDETTHGINTPVQKRWTNNIANELATS
jgi:hypothetical protein